MSERYAFIEPGNLAALKQAHEHYGKWMVDLFTPKGIEILFGVRNAFAGHGDGAGACGGGADRAEAG